MATLRSHDATAYTTIPSAIDSQTPMRSKVISTVSTYAIQAGVKIRRPLAYSQKSALLPSMDISMNVRAVSTGNVATKAESVPRPELPRWTTSAVMIPPSKKYISRRMQPL